MDEWDVRIEPRGDVLGKELQEHMRTSGEHTVTHVARLRRADATPFSESAALAVLREFDDLLSFGTGRTISCLLPVGWLAGAPVWTHWAALRAVDPPLQVTSWVHDTTAVPQMTALLAAGHNAYRNPLICESFRAALTFYLTANFDAPATMGTLMSVSGMQIVAYAHFVSDPACQSPVKKNDWESLSAVSILRKILKPTLVDMAVPPWLTNLAKRYSDSVISNPKQPPPDALSVVIKLRNSVAHPSTKALGKWTHYDWVEAGFYSMHFFEVLLLWWLGYDGEYRPRTDPSANKTVPWATNFPTGLGKGPANTEP
ncbi:hypothetical protein AB4Z14_03875 [Terrabacter sp. 2TAF16]|uniref:hypothetical protein n=1 Tax=Terrabacter sp. 2TAF16 TaxID=3233008 RepID=UPI003F9E409A